MEQDPRTIKETEREPLRPGLPLIIPIREPERVPVKTGSRS